MGPDFRQDDGVIGDAAASAPAWVAGSGAEHRDDNTRELRETGARNAGWESDTEMKRIAPSLKAAMPAAEAGWFDMDYDVLADGSLAIIRASHDVVGDWRRHQERLRNGSSGESPRVPPGTMARLSVFDGISETDCFRFPFSSDALRVDRLSADEWLVVENRHTEQGDNVRVFDTHGRPLRRFDLNGPFAHLQCDDAGSIWVGYTDDVASTVPWRPDTSLADPRPGINRYDTAGRMTWAYLADERMMQSYALNVARDAVWAYYYDGFPIVRIAGDGSVRIWRNRRKGACLLATDGPHVVLAGGYDVDDEAGGHLLRRDDRLALLRLDRSEATMVGELELDLFGATARDLDHAYARDDRLHFIHDGKWYVLAVQEVLDALT